MSCDRDCINCQKEYCTAVYREVQKELIGGRNNEHSLSG